jgi:beta-glucanase (GH16 family)
MARNGVPFQQFLARLSGVFLILSLFLAAFFPCRVTAQDFPANPLLKPGWTLTFNDEFNQLNLASLFSSSGPWCSMDGCWNPESGTDYSSPVPAWFAPNCDQPALNTSLTGSSLVLTVRKNPGRYTVYRFPTASLTLNSKLAKLTDLRDLAVGDIVSDTLGAVPSNTTITAILPDGIELSNAATATVTGDLLPILSCVNFTFTEGFLYSKQAFLYGYFEIRAKIPLRGQYTSPSFWMWGQDSVGTYREIDVFEFGTPTTLDNVLMNLHLAKGIDGGAPDSAVWNDYPSAYILKNPDGSPGYIDKYFHLYAVKWTPNSVTWYVDNKQVYQVVGHSPHYAMNVVARTGIQFWMPPPDCVFPSDYEIDYIRVYANDSKEFMFQWGNAGTKKIGNWDMSATDRFFSGRFETSGKSQLVAIDSTGQSKVLTFDGVSWNSTPGKIAVGDTPVDRFVVGDFDGGGRDELLSISKYHRARLWSYQGGHWSIAWSDTDDTNTTGIIGPWPIQSGDRYVAGDFDGDGKDELLAIGSNGRSQLLRFSDGDWSSIWSNGGGKNIGQWNVGYGDTYLSGDFDGQGQKKLLAIAGGSGWARVMKFDGVSWVSQWDNQHSGMFHLWQMKPTDNYLVGNFDGGKQDQLLALAPNGSGWSQLMSYSTGTWQATWTNDGAAKVHTWLMNPGDAYFSGDFNGQGRKDLFAIAKSGWSQLLTRKVH